MNFLTKKQQQQQQQTTTTTTTHWQHFGQSVEVILLRACSDTNSLLVDYQITDYLLSVFQKLWQPGKKLHQTWHTRQGENTESVA